ncbi:uncharacterized protein LOC141656448 [Silene latifolia]|uniref:uncharacterized protein LOC141656448 n=1 Tax=Silene latifolia TaxID=37657 RepID=UPI003D771502
MASTTPLFFNSHNNQNSRSQPQPNTNTTNPRLDSTPTQNPKPRSRKPGRSQKGPNKIPQRGMGVEKLEIERLQREKGIISPTHHNRILASKMLSTNNNNNNGFSNVSPLPGIPVHPYPTLAHYYFPGQPGPAIELPSMPNHNNTLSYKKKRVNGEEQNQEGLLVGFGKGKEKQHFGDYYDQSLFQMSKDFNNHGVNYGGFDVNYNNNYGDSYHHVAVNHGAFSGYNDFTAMTGSEVMAIQRKLSRSKVMEYGFFPGKSDTVNEEQTFKDFDFNNNNNNNNNNNMINNYYYYRSTDYLDLKLGCSDSSYTNSSPSSSLTTATNTTNVVVSDTFLDLSLKLSNY